MIDYLVDCGNWERLRSFWRDEMDTTEVLLLRQHQEMVRQYDCVDLFNCYILWSWRSPWMIRKRQRTRQAVLMLWTPVRILRSVIIAETCHSKRLTPTLTSRDAQDVLQLNEVKIELTTDTEQTRTKFHCCIYLTCWPLLVNGGSVCGTESYYLTLSVI